ncbi:MAG: flavodoxin family protein [Oscillospiraceae bacterium]
MKIVLIHGQNHKGSSYHIGRMLAEKMGTENSISEFFLPRDLGHFCLGCYRCVENEEDCPFHAQKCAIMEEAEKADILIFTTPTYCLHTSAPMKAFMDLTFTYWMSHKPRREMFSKRAAVISTAAGSGAKSAVKDISDMLFYWGVPVVKRYGIAVQAMNWEQVAPEKKAKIEKDVTKIADALLKKEPKPSIKTKFMFNMMRMMQIKNWGASPTEKEYWRGKGWLGKSRPWD